ncbi:MAG TPA: SpoIID/LytB domain-containing protein [Myxococcaceae bacterium]|nr:SpoIID/LytB domain-containing protein [Myxococcaceae bacterium]
MARAVAVLTCLVAPAAFAVETMRIHMADVSGEVLLSADGLGFSPDVEDAPLSPSPGGRSGVRLAGGRIEIDGAPWPEPAIRFRAEGQSAPALGPHSIRAGSFEVRGEVVIQVHGRALQLINVIALEHYLAAVLGSEMPSWFPEEALKAQAVAARTYALHKKLEAYDQPYHLGSSVLHQVYGGLRREDERTRAAVDATRGEVLTWDLQPIEAYFHASCGGRTEDGLHALGRDLPYLHSVTCPCGSSAVSRWEASVSPSDVEAAIGAPGANLVIASRTPTGRVERLRAGSRPIDAVTFRRRLGYARVKSLSFDVQPARDGELRLTGRGHGHGAGLCQWGARALATQGRSYRQILAHYYAGTELQVLY